MLTWPRPLPFPASLSQHASIHACLVCGCTLTHCVWSVCRICGSCRQQSLWYPQVALASVNIFHAVIATEKHVRYGWHYFVTLVAVVGGAANSKSAVDDFVKLKRIESLACVINSSERNDFLRFYVYLCCLPLSFICQMFFIWVLSSTKVSEFSDICKHWIIYCYPMTCFFVKITNLLI